MSRNLSNIILLFVAAIWGFAFVAQRVGMQFIGPFTFNGLRFLLGGIALFPFALYVYSKENKAKKYTNKRWLIGGLWMGLVLFFAASLQQIGMVYTTAGNAGFITGLYVVFVPIIGLFFRHKTSTVIWFSVLLSVAGLFFLTMNEKITVNKGDLFVFASAILWAVHVLVIGYYTKRANALMLSVIQFLFCGVFSLVFGFLLEDIRMNPVVDASWAILYGGLLSVGVAYTLQVVAQRHARPAVAAILLSSESLFALIGGVALLSEAMSGQELFGCGLILFAILLAQIDSAFLKKINDRYIKSFFGNGGRLA